MKLTKEAQLLKELCEIDGIGGHEKNVRKFMEREFLEVVPKEEISYDGLGSIIARKTGDPAGPKIMLAGHMDEIGMIVTKITDEGFLKFQTIGGWWSQVMLAQQYTVTTVEGKTYEGVIGSKPPHLLKPEEAKAAATIDDMFLDIGVKNKEEAENLGIRVGDMRPGAFRPLANPIIFSAGIDNRLGCGSFSGVQGLKDETIRIRYGVGTVQEEVGLRAPAPPDTRSNRTFVSRLTWESPRIPREPICR